MLASQRLAIAAHLHVLLRRKTGRVTDTEWMATNRDYAAEIVRFCRAKADEDGHADLAEWAGKLEQAIAAPAPAARPLAQAALELLREAAAPPGPGDPVPAEAVASGFGASPGRDSGLAQAPGGERKPREPDAPRYVGGIR